MKMTLLTLLITISNLNFANACEGENDFTGVNAARATLDGKLSCTLDGKTSEATISIYAKSKCGPNSPVYGQLNIFGTQQTLASVKQISNTEFEIQSVGQVNSYICQLEQYKITKDSKKIALLQAEKTYESIVGFSHSRNYEIKFSETTFSNDVNNIEFVIFMATEKVNGINENSYEIQIKLINGKIATVSVVPGG